jgi:hypothetical protein
VFCTWKPKAERNAVVAARLPSVSPVDVPLMEGHLKATPKSQRECNPVTRFGGCRQNDKATASDLEASLMCWFDEMALSRACSVYINTSIAGNLGAGQCGDGELGGNDILDQSILRS